MSVKSEALEYRGEIVALDSDAAKLVFATRGTDAGSNASGALYRIDCESGELSSVPLAAAATAMTVIDGVAWVATDDGEVASVTAKAKKPKPVIKLEQAAVALAPSRNDPTLSCSSGATQPDSNRRRPFFVPLALNKSIAKRRSRKLCR